jgi:mRNA interferase HigB
LPVIRSASYPIDGVNIGTLASSAPYPADGLYLLFRCCSDDLPLTVPIWEHRVWVRIISKKAIREFGKRHSDAVASLADWHRIVAAAKWDTTADVKATFRNADFVGGKTVFNIAMNRYRLIAFIMFRTRVVYIKAILTHKEYDKETWKNAP